MLCSMSVVPVDVESVRESFAASCPTFESTSALDRLRQREYARLERDGHVYLDFTGGGLYPDSLIRRHMERLREGVFGNPHSVNPTSVAAGELVEATRRKVLDYFSAPADEYEVIFTANASQALKLIGESYPFRPGDRLLLTFDNHNSVNGIREYDRASGAETTYVPLDSRMRIEDSMLEQYLDLAESGRNNLFAFPAQSNFSGVQHPLYWIERASSRGWDVLLDAAAFVPTNRLDLSAVKPDYVALSFYKMLGYPTGVGALLARREALAKLHRPWFAGGTIEVASVQADNYVLAHGEEAWEDGTLDYLNIPAVGLGLELLESVGIETVHERVTCLTRWLLDRILELSHSGGQPLVRVYGPVETEMRGGTVAMNFLGPDGRVVDHQKIELLAAERQISLRTGCFCNPGAGEVALGLTRGEIETCFSHAGSDLTLEEFRGCIDPTKGTGAVRVSLGLVSTLEDVEAFIAFARSLAS